MGDSNLKQRAAKGFFWGGISNGAQQVIGVVFGIILLNRLTPDDYGMIGMLAIFLGIANTLQDSGFTVALANRPSFDPNDYNSVFWFNLFAGTLFYVILFFCAPLIAQFYHQPALTPLARVLFLSIPTGSFGIAHNAILFREMMVKERAKIDVFSLLFSGIVGIILALNGYGYWALAIQTLLFSSSCTILRWVFSTWRPTFTFDIKPIREMFGFSSKMLASTIIGQVQTNIFSILLGRFANRTDVGYYSQGTKWAGMGSQVINGMMTSVSQPLFNKVKDDRDRLVNIFRKIMRFVAFVSCPFLLGIAFISEEFINIINPQFAPCIPILIIYCVISLIGCLIVPYTQLCVSLEKSGYYLKASLFYSIAQIVAALIAIRWGMYTLAMTSLLLTIIYAVVWHAIVNKLVGLSLWCIIRDIAPYAVISIVSMAVAFPISKTLVENPLSIMAIKIIVVAILYCAAMYFLGSKIYKEFIEFIKNTYGGRTN